MKIIEYQSGDRHTLRQLCEQLPPVHGLRYADFVDHYYASSEYCRLHVMLDDSERCVGCVGVEKMPFETPVGAVTVGFGSNYHAFESGAGGILFLHWVRQCGLGLNFGGSPDAQRIIDHQKWTRFSGIDTLHLNAAYAQSPGDSFWKRTAKHVLASSPLKRRIDRQAAEVLRSLSGQTKAIPEQRATDDLLSFESPFDVRFAPDPEYLNWRYATDLSFARYHLLRIVENGESVGYVILNEQPNRVLIAHADASSPELLARGIIAALGTVCRGRLSGTGVVATTSHPLLKQALLDFGFRPRRNGRGLAIGGLGKRPPFPADTSNWLINEDWGDNGLRAPFLGRAPDFTDVSDDSHRSAA
ncbi:MAG: hypothetical protein ACYTGL_16175 [Planctomycetota bacterium]